MICTGDGSPEPTLPEVKPTSIRLELQNPEDGRSAAALEWAWPASEKATYFEIYQSLRKDSLGAPVQVLDRTGDTARAQVRLPDTSRPMTVYYGIRAVLNEATGQKIYGKAIPVDSLTVNPSLGILSPATRSYQAGRTLEVEVQTSSDDGIVLRQVIYQKDAGAWSRLLDTCLPMAACAVPHFGNKSHRDALVLQAPGPADTLQSLYCVLGDESFEDLSTGRRQSLGCIRFFRTGEP
jgi:hypothetical protein